MINAQRQANSWKQASKCTETDYNNFYVAEDILRIELISDGLFEAWNKIFDISHKNNLAAVKSGTEVAFVQPLTKNCLSKRLDMEDVKNLLSFGEQVGFHSDTFKVCGFSDKASCPAGSYPDHHRPSAQNVKNFHSPVILTGSWEDKALNIPFGHSQTAQLFSSMDGFVEGARQVFKIQFRHFGGILAGVKEINGKNVLVCKCAYWFMTSGGEIMRQTSKLLTTEHEVASGFEWWIGQSVNQLKFWQSSYNDLMVSNLHISKTLDSIEEFSEGQLQDENNDDSVGNHSTSAHNDQAPNCKHISHACTNRVRLDDYIVKIKSKELNVANQTQQWLLSSTVGIRRT